MVLRYLFLVVIILTILTRPTRSLPVNKFQVNSEKNQNALENDSDYSDDYSDEISSAKTQNARSDTEMKEFEKRLDDVLDWYYEKYVNPENVRKPEQKPSENEIESDAETLDPHDRMQSDQPATVTTNFGFNGDGPLSPLYPLYSNLTGMVNISKYSDEIHNFTDSRYLDMMRNRTKDMWIQMLKDNVLRQVGRVNSSMPRIGEEIELSILNNISNFMPSLHIPNDSIIDDEFVTQKIRSYYPSCEIPRNTDQEVWKDENTMNLYFSVDHGPEENGISIATATLRLYRLPHENSNTSGGLDSSCENTSVGEDDKLLRISIYWYTRSLKKHRVKRRLSDSKVIGESAKWVELSVRPATRAWIKGRNLGLAVLVEDQDGTILKADKYFKGASCTVGTSTPKPIPTVIADAARRANELERSHGNPGRNSTATMYNYVSLLPKIDICTLEFPQNFTYNPMSVTNLRIKACDLKKMHDQTQKLLERENLEKFAALASIVPPNHHIRHQRQHLQDLDIDPRSRMVGRQIVITNEELRNYNAQSNRNFTNINR